MSDRTIVLTVPPDHLWLDAEAAGRMLSQSTRQFREETSKQPGFPKPGRTKPGGHPKWLASEIHQWMLAQRERTGPGRQRAA